MSVKDTLKKSAKRAAAIAAAATMVMAPEANAEENSTLGEKDSVKIEQIRSAQKQPSAKNAEMLAMHVQKLCQKNGILPKNTVVDCFEGGYIVTSAALKDKNGFPIARYFDNQGNEIPAENFKISNKEWKEMLSNLPKEGGIAFATRAMLALRNASNNRTHVSFDGEGNWSVVPPGVNGNAAYNKGEGELSYLTERTKDMFEQVVDNALILSLAPVIEARDFARNQGWLDKAKKVR